MPVADGVGLTAGQGYIRKMPLTPCGIDGGKRDLMGGCAVINLSQGTLPSIDGLFDDVRSPPMP